MTLIKLLTVWDTLSFSLAFSSLNYFVKISDILLSAVSVLFDISSVTPFMLSDNFVFSFQILELKLSDPFITLLVYS